MTSRYRTLFISGLLVFSASSHAGLPEDINRYFRQLHPKPMQVSVEIKTPIDRCPPAKIRYCNCLRADATPAMCRCRCYAVKNARLCN
nr:hypothetical protein [Morganella morganii]